MSTLPTASRMAKYLPGSSNTWPNGLIPASLTRPRSCRMQSSRWSSLEISRGVCRSGLELKYSYTFSCNSRYFPLMYVDSFSVSTSSFTLAQVCSRSCGGMEGRRGSAGERWLYSRCIRRAEGRDSPASAVLPWSIADERIQSVAVGKTTMWTVG